MHIYWHILLSSYQELLAKYELMLLSHQYGPDSWTLKNSFQLELFYDLTSICTWWWNNISKSLKWIIYRSKHKTKIYCITSITRLFELQKRILVAYLPSQSEGKKPVDLPLCHRTQLSIDLPFVKESWCSSYTDSSNPPFPETVSPISSLLLLPRSEKLRHQTLLHENIVDRLKIKLNQNCSAGLTPI